MISKLIKIITTYTIVLPFLLLPENNYAINIIKIVVYRPGREVISIEEVNNNISIRIIPITSELYHKYFIENSTEVL